MLPRLYFGKQQPGSYLPIVGKVNYQALLRPKPER